MNGADVLCSTLLASGIDTCFANPGTSEMHFVAALDQRPEMRCVLGLFEGVVTGAADGYARMTDRPAATLLHTGPGLANGLANLHNARRAETAMVNIVGDHASTHLQYDAPLTTDIEGLARPMSHWVGRIGGAASLQRDTEAAIAAARSGAGQVATLILPADAAWSDARFDETAGPILPAAATSAPAEEIEAAARAIHRAGPRCLLLLGGRALRAAPLAEAARIARATGAGVLSETSNARCEHGRGRHAPARVPYLVDVAVERLAGYDTVILIGARAPVAFFGFPDRPHVPTRPDAEILPLAGRGADLAATLAQLREALGIPATAPLPARDDSPVACPEGALDTTTLPAAVAHALPEYAILCDESISMGFPFALLAARCAPHDHLQLTGGAIGIGPALAAGAAIACPDRPVLSLQADGSAFYTVQGLWTQAREGLNVVTVILSNRKYQSLYGELHRLGRNAPGTNARAMLDLDNPAVDWPALARGFGVGGSRVERAEDLAAAITRAFRAGGPHLIEAVL